MKSLLRSILTNLLVLYLCGVIYPGFVIKNDFKVLLSAAVVWFFLNKIVKPVIKLLLLPINLITLNLFSWAINMITLFILQNIVGDIAINSYQFLGVDYQGFVVPPIFINLFFSYLITSSLLNLLSNTIKWLISKDE